jgi:hypothetical protein
MHAAAEVVPRLRRTPPTDQELDADTRIMRDLEWHVDLHTFTPDDITLLARRAGFVGVHVETEELVSSLVGWAVRTIEAETPPGLLGARWAAFAYRAYLHLYELDVRLSRVLPRRLFYNLLLFGERPAC